MQTAIEFLKDLGFLLALFASLAGATWAGLYSVPIITGFIF